jgi:2-amino-4-hydroxy-6-hydroxymethyldihydropteridine diphosphokinase
MPQVIAYVGMGGNLDDPVARIGRALDDLDRLPRTVLCRVSSFYRNPPMGPAEQPHFVNAVAEIETGLDASRLLNGLQAIETASGRVRGLRWGPRTLDLDLLLYGAEQSDDPQLTLPHPGVAKRAFVLVPLAEIAATVVVPGLGAAAALRDALPLADISSLERIFP